MSAPPVLPRIGDHVGPHAAAHPEREALLLGFARDAALLVHTSGTTGRPKGAPIPRRAPAGCGAAQAGRWHADPLRVLCNLPVDPIGFMGDGCAHALVAGGATVFMERFEPEAIPALIERERLGGWGQAPTTFALALARSECARHDLSSLRRLVWGGARAPRQPIAALQRTGAGVSTSHGSTETGRSITYAHGDADLDQLAETVGRPDPHFEVRVAGEGGRPVAPGELGEIQVRGDHVMLGCRRRPEAAREAIDAEGCLLTGDLALLRPDGCLALRGRTSETYESGGENVHPREVELALEEHPDVPLAAVLGVADALYGEVGHAVVMRRPGTRTDEEALRAHCRARLVNFKVPKRVFVRDALPMLPIGEVDERALCRESAE